MRLNEFIWLFSFFKFFIVREMKEKIEEKKLKLSHAGLESLDQNPDPEGAGLKPAPHPEKPGFNLGPVLYFSHPVRSRATAKPKPDPDFAKPTARWCPSSDDYLHLYYKITLFSLKASVDFMFTSMRWWYLRRILQTFILVFGWWKSRDKVRCMLWEYDLEFFRRYSCSEWFEYKWMNMQYQLEDGTSYKLLVLGKKFRFPFIITNLNIMMICA